MRSSECFGDLARGVGGGFVGMCWVDGDVDAFSFVPRLPRDERPCMGK